MGQLFEPYDPDQGLLFPPSLDDWLPENHLARFVSETVDELDLSAFLKKYCEREDGRGRIAYHPRMMLKVLIYSYSEGIFSSRKIAAGLENLVALRFLAAGNSPSHRTIARFRQENISRFKMLFVEVVRIAVGAGLVKMGTLAIDGSKVKANASKHKAMSYSRMKSEEKRIEKEIDRITEVARNLDEAEDAEFGPDFRGDELPEEMRRREDRLKKIREVKARLEREQAEQDEASGRVAREKRSGRKPPKRPNGVPKDSKQASFTDPDSRLMGNFKTGFVQGYNAQIAVDEATRVLVAADVTQSPSDVNQLIPLTTAAIENTERKPKRVLADSGYKLERAFERLEELEIDAHVAIGKGEVNPDGTVRGGPATTRMHRKRRTKRSRVIYKRRKAIVEAPFGWIKSVLGFRSFSMRGFDNVRGEWDLVCLALNLKRMATRVEWVT